MSSNIIDFHAARKKKFPGHKSTDNPRLTYLVPLWLAERRVNNLQESGIESYRDVFLLFVKFAGDIRVQDLDVDLVKRYKCARMEQVDASTTRQALTVIRAFCTWAVEEGYLEENPTDYVSNPKVTPPNPDPLSREQIHQLIAAIDQPPRTHKHTWRRNRRAVCLMLYAGLRKAEAAGLEWRDVDLERRTLTVRREVAKGGKSRVLPICDELLEELKAAPRRELHWAVVDQGEGEGAGKPLKAKSLGHLCERWLAGRGVRIHAHQLRKTFATELHMRDEDIATIQRLLGHADPKTTMRYIGISAQKEHAAVQKLRFREPDES